MKLQPPLQQKRPLEGGLSWDRKRQLRLLSLGTLSPSQWRLVGRPINTSSSLFASPSHLFTINWMDSEVKLSSTAKMFAHRYEIDF